MNEAAQAPTQKKAKLLQPSLHATAFKCLHCEVFAHQRWHCVGTTNYVGDSTPGLTLAKHNLLRQVASRTTNTIVSRFTLEKMTMACDHKVQNCYIAVCSHCSGVSIWENFTLIFPQKSEKVLPHADLPVDLLSDFIESSSLIFISPRASAAIARLIIEKLLDYLNCQGKNTNQKIAFLVKKGLDPQVQMILDSIRVIGNSAVHPGTIDFRDNSDLAIQILDSINIIIEIMVTQPKKIAELYDKIPDNKRREIEARDVDG